MNRPLLCATVIVAAWVITWSPAIRAEERTNQTPQISSRIDLISSVVSDSGATTTRTFLSLSADGRWGPWSARATVRTDDPLFTGGPGPSPHAFALHYADGPLTFGLGDTKTHLSRFTTQESLWAPGVNHRGVDASLSLGAFRSQLGAGRTQHAEPEEAYERTFRGLRQSFALHGARVGLNASSLIDREDEGIIISPEQNYIVTLDGTVTARGIEVGFEAGVSSLFPNARGLFWDASSEERHDLPEPYPQIVALLERTPHALRPYLPVPHPDYWRSAPPLIDFGSEAYVKVPVPRAILELRAVHFGPDFRTLGGTAGEDREGFLATLRTERFGNTSYSVGLGTHQDNVHSLLDKMQGHPPATPDLRNRFITLEGGINHRTPTWTTYDFNVKHEVANAEKDPSTFQPHHVKTETTTVTARAGNYPVSLGPYTLRVGAGLTSAAHTDHRNHNNNKTTTTLRTTTGLTHGPWQVSLGYAHKLEAYVHGDAFHSPSVTFRTSWTVPNYELAGLELHRLRVEFWGMSSVMRSLLTHSTSSQFLVQAQLDPTSATRWTMQLRRRITENMNTASHEIESTALIGYEIRY